MALTSEGGNGACRDVAAEAKDADRLHPQRRRAGPRKILDQRSPRYLEPRIPVATRNCPPSRLPRQLKRKSRQAQTIRQRPLSRRWAVVRVYIVARRTRKHHGIPRTLPSGSQGSPEPKAQEPEVHAMGPQKQQPQAQANRDRVAFTERDTQRKHEEAKEGEARSSVKKETPANRKRKGKPRAFRGGQVVSQAGFAFDSDNGGSSLERSCPSPNLALSYV